MQPQKPHSIEMAINFWPQHSFSLCFTSAFRNALLQIYIHIVCNEWEKFELYLLPTYILHAAGMVWSKRSILGKSVLHGIIVIYVYIECVARLFYTRFYFAYKVYQNSLRDNEWHRNRTMKWGDKQHDWTIII